jgi:hypothetical protein
MSQAMGTFEQNWTLDCVCDECNAFFSRELELPLGRDSAEAFFRIEAGVKPPMSAERFLGKHMKSTVQGTQHFEGARTRMHASEDGESLEPHVVPQVAFRKPGGLWSYKLEADLSLEMISEWLGKEPCEIKILGQPPDVERLRQRLGVLGVSVTPTKHLRGEPITEGSSVAIEHEFFVGTPHRRAAAKIVFNYTAKVLGCATVRRSEFNPVRKFVRLGEEPLPVVIPSETPILVGEGADSTQTHACGIGWVEQRRQLVGALRLFNRVTCGVVLCEPPHGEWVGVSFQHLFDPVSRRISDVTPR